MNRAIQVHSTHPPRYRRDLVRKYRMDTNSDRVERDLRPNSITGFVRVDPYCHIVVEASKYRCLCTKENGRFLLRVDSILTIQIMGGACRMGMRLRQEEALIQFCES